MKRHAIWIDKTFNIFFTLFGKRFNFLTVDYKKQVSPGDFDYPSILPTNKRS